MDLLAKVAAAAGPAHSNWCEECALPRILKLANHRDYNIRAVRRADGRVQEPCLLHALLPCTQELAREADSLIIGGPKYQHARRPDPPSATLPCLPQHSVSGLVQLAGCLPLEARSGPLMSAFAELCGDTVRPAAWPGRVLGWTLVGCTRTSQTDPCCYMQFAARTAL